MKIGHWIIILGAVAACFVSCKEKEEETDSYLSGKLVVEGLPSYVMYGETYHIKSYGLYKGTDQADSLLGYRWYDPFTKVTDTLRFETDPASVKPDFNFTISKDTLATLTLMVTGWATDYYSSSSSASFTIVNPSLQGGSLTGHPFSPSMSTVTDERDGLQYYTAKIGETEWMLQNLAWKGSGKAYVEEEAMSYIYGRYYTWHEAVEACPEGWRLPSEDDYLALAAAAGATAPGRYSDIAGVAGNLMGDVSFNGNAMWEYWPDVPKSNSTLFTAIPVGYLEYLENGLNFTGLGNYSIFWTSDSVDDASGVARYIYVDKNIFFAAPFDKKNLAAPVRCVRDEKEK